MTSINGDVTTLIEGIQIDDARLYQILQTLNSRLVLIEEELTPLVRQAEELAVPAAIPIAPTNFAYILTPTTVRFSWLQVADASQYEVRLGTVWETASFVFRTSGLQADIDPLLVGTYDYLLKAINNIGQYSELSTTLIVTVPPIGTPSLSSRAIDNNILLSWTTPASAFSIDYYVLRRDDSDIGHVRGNFTTYFELIAGVYIYSIEAVDIAGNVSARSSVAITLSIPADFVLESVRTSSLGSFETSADYFLYIEVPAGLGDVNFRYVPQVGFEGEVTHFYYAQIDVSSTLTNVVLMDGPALLACWVPTTFQVHFTGNSWLTPQEQVDANYPIYIEPAGLTGSYEEIIDYGGTFANLIATITWNSDPITADGVSVVVKMAVSADGITYSAETAGASQFFASFRFLKFRLEFTGSVRALLKISNLTISLNVKKELDSGHTIADSTDVEGTVVLFNKVFKDIESITLTVEAIEPVIAIYEFVDVPNPTSFSIYALDTTGNRITYPVSWKARGVV